MCSCCNPVYGCCRRMLEPIWSVLRVLENIPIIGHIIAAFYACVGLRSKAERAGLKATLGLILTALNSPAEIIDEIGRHRSKKIYSYILKPKPDWMKKFSRRTLRHLCLPGSHQSGTYKVDRKLSPIPLIIGWSQCQRADIEYQLLGGIRFLDLRLMTDDKTKEIWLHHNVMTCVKFKEVLESVRDFVKEYPSEIVGMHLTNDGKQLDWGTVHSFINEYLGERLVPQHMSSMAIGDIVEYGKNFIVFGVPGVSYSWNNLANRWPNKPWPSQLQEDMTETLRDLAAYNPYDLFWYKAECTINATVIVRNFGGVAGLVASRCAEEKFEFLEDLAAATNERVLRVLKEVNRLPVQVLSTDYVNDDIIARIIEMNENEETGAGRMSVLSTGRMSSVAGSVRLQSGSSLRGSSLVGSTRLPSSSSLQSSQVSGSAAGGPGRLPSAVLEASVDLSEALVDNMYDPAVEDVIYPPVSPTRPLEVWESTL